MLLLKRLNNFVGFLTPVVKKILIWIKCLVAAPTLHVVSRFLTADDMEFPGVLKKEHVEIPGQLKKKWNFRGSSRKNYVEFPRVLDFDLRTSRVSRNFAEYPGVKACFVLNW